MVIFGSNQNFFSTKKAISGRFMFKLEFFLYKKGHFWPFLAQIRTSSVQKRRFLAIFDSNQNFFSTKKAKKAISSHFYSNRNFFRKKGHFWSFLVKIRTFLVQDRQFLFEIEIKSSFSTYTRKIIYDHFWFIYGYLFNTKKNLLAFLDFSEV